MQINLWYNQGSLTETIMKHPIDVNVGRRMRQRRWMLGMTQQQLAQIQKYESGMNRVSASRLYEIAVALDVPISYFFEGASGSSDPEDEEDLLANREALELVRAFYAIPEAQRRRLLDLARVLGNAA